MYKKNSLKGKKIKDGLINEIRERFAHVDTCPEQGKRIFFRKRGRRIDLEICG